VDCVVTQIVKALRTGPRNAAPAVMSSQYGSSCSDQDMLRSSLVNCIYLTPPGPRLSLEAPAREALTREAEPRGQCVPRQSLGTRRKTVTEGRSALWRIFALVFLAGALTAGLLLLRDQRFQQAVADFLEWARHHQVEGVCALVLAYVLACVLLVPGSVMTLGAGFAFGLGLGFAAVFVGSNVGAALAFFLGRTLARGWIEKKVAGNARFRAIDQAVGRQGFKIVLLLRLSPVFPF